MIPHSRREIRLLGLDLVTQPVAGDSIRQQVMVVLVLGGGARGRGEAVGDVEVRRNFSHANRPFMPGR